MSLPYEQVMAQERVWKEFSEGGLPRKLWPKHFMSAAELKILFSECEENRIRSEVYRELLSEMKMTEKELDALVEKKLQSPDETLRRKINFNDSWVND